MTANLFSDGQRSWAGIFLDTNNDGNVDYSLETDDTPFEGNYFKDGLLEDRTTGQPVFSTRCAVQNWTNLNTNANWIGFTWIAPADSSSVIGYELSVKKGDTSDWVVISSVTPQQMSISVELMSLESTSQYKIASILESGKLAFNKAVLTHAGVVD